MPVTVTHSAGRPDFDWEKILYEALKDGTFGAPNFDNTSITLTYNDHEIVLTGALLNSADPASLSAGTITGITIKELGGDVVNWADVNLDFSTINGWITDVGNDTGTAPYETYYSQEFHTGVIFPLIDSGAMGISGNGSGDADSIFGSGFADVLNGGSGDDYFITRGVASDNPGAADQVNGDGGWNMIDLRPGAPVGGLTVNVTSGTDGEVRNASNTVIVNFTGIQGFALSDGDDIFNGGNADEYIEAFDGSDQIYAGGGWDKLSYRFETGGAGITVNVDAGTVIDTYGNTDFFTDIEGFKGSKYGDTFIGSGRNDINDYFEGMAGNDTFRGNGGRDMVDYQWEFELGGTAGVTVTLVDGGAAGTATDGFGNTDTLYDITDLGGTQYNDTLNGNSSHNFIDGYGGNNTINGLGGNDDLRARGGNDTINGGDGDDRIRGGDGINTLNGDAGNDNIRGGRGNDTVTAGSGNFDLIAGTSGTDTVNGNEGRDMIAFDVDFANTDQYTGDGITVTLDNLGIGSGTVTGNFWRNLAFDAVGVVNTTFENLEHVVGTWKADTFTATDLTFQNTDDADSTFFGLRGVGGVFGFTGGDGIDTFNISNGLAMIDYDEEKWRHNGFDGSHEWGDNGGEDGVIINLTGSSHDGVDGGKARDTFGNDDVLNVTGQISLRLTMDSDIVWAGSGDVWAEGNRGEDVFHGGTGNDSFNGGDDNDTMDGGGGSDEFNGDEGDDTFNGGTGRDFAWGGNGSDTLNGDTGNDDLNGDDGSDTLNGGDGSDNLNGGNDDDVINGGNGNDRLHGGNESDTIHGNANDDRIEGDGGNDNVFGDAGEDDVRGYGGIDRVSGGLGGDRVEGNEENDLLSGDDDFTLNEATPTGARLTNLANGISNLGGADWMSGGSGNDLMFGGYGADEMHGDDGNDTLYGGQGTDVLWGHLDNDTLNGGDGDDEMYGDEGDDTINGDNGNDFMSGWIGVDIMHGNNGNDRLNGDDGNDQLFGDSGNDVLEAGANDDTLNGGANDDTLWAGSGNDILIGGAGVDHLEGEGGNDTYRFLTANNDLAQDTIFDNGGTADKIESDATTSLFNFSNIENLTLTGAGAINGTGDNSGNVLTGNGSVNTLTGNNGNDTLNGLGANDILNGGANNDTLRGGTGADSLTGGANFDSFAFAAGDSGLLATTLDTVTDYAKGAVGVGDEFDFTVALTKGGNNLAATATQASINNTTGMATFFAGSGTTLADALNDITGRFQAASNTAGDFAFFRVNGAGPLHLFISDGVAGLGANDVLIKINNQTVVNTFSVAGGDLTILT